MSNPYEAPKGGGRADADVDDDVPLTTPALALLAGVATGAAGLFVAASGMQVVVLVTVYSYMKVVPWMLMLLGGAATLLGGTITTGRFWAVVVAVLVNALMGVLTLIWAIYASMNGLVALLPFVAVMLSLLAGLLLPIALPGARRVSQARARLMR